MYYNIIMEEGAFEVCATVFCNDEECEIMDAYLYTGKDKRDIDVLDPYRDLPDSTIMWLESEAIDQWRAIV